jgi:hypothetical protein
MSSRPYWKGCAAPAEWPQGCAGLGFTIAANKSSARLRAARGHITRTA